MQLEDYFDFLAPDDIRLKGHRIGIETVLLAYLEGESPEMIRARLPSLSLEKIHATITYYYHYRDQVDAYLKAHLEYCEEARRRYDAEPHPEVQRLLEAKRRMQEQGQWPDAR